jgi:hypothetical protein
MASTAIFTLLIKDQTALIGGDFNHFFAAIKTIGGNVVPKVLFSGDFISRYGRCGERIV